MNDYLVAEFINSVDSIISEPIQQTQRIKYTAFDVSNKFIIFGASSGGLYFFNRHPCSFSKLIPSTEGSVVYLSISNDEKYIAVATIKGTLCIFDNNNDDAITKNVQIYTEHQGNIITAMKWNHNSTELYSGDNTGKVSVVMVTNFITKTMFQTPCATLMQLDSRIIQLDWGSYFLLVSTLSRVYLCDTQSEHYRQIGIKLRDGEYGACFFGTKFSYTLPSERKIALGSFSILNDKESFVTYDGLENLQMFCARPGARIWEVQFSGTVVRTHQFKQALMKGSNNVITLENDCDCRLNFKISNTDLNSLHLCYFNFMKMYVLNNNFILTFQKNGLYVLDPQNVAVIFWTDVFTDIIDVRIVRKFIYLWTSKNQMHVLLFSNLEDFIIKALLNKKYLLCADLCISYQAHIKKILPLAKKLYLVSNLDEKILELNEIVLVEQIQPILNMIKEFCSNRQTAQKMSSGIFVVDNAHFINNTLSNNIDKISTPVVTPNISRNNSEIFMPLDFDFITKEKDNNKIVEIDSVQTDKIESDNYVDKCSTSSQEINKKYNLLLEEYELNKINNKYKTNLLEIVFNSCLAVNELVEIFNGFENFTQTLNLNQSDIHIWCYITCLKYIETHKCNYLVNDIETNGYVKDAFVIINSSNDNSCKCGFPLPNTKLLEPKFYTIGQILINYSWKLKSDFILCHKVPYLWKDIIKLREDEELNSLLPLIIQYGDMEILNHFLSKFTYDLWNEIVQKIILLKKNICLNCEQSFNCDYVGFSWNNLANEMIKSIGAESSVCLLLQNAEKIPNSELNLEFYQSCMFSTILDNFDTKLRNRAVLFVNNIHDKEENSRNHFGKLLEKSLFNSETTNTSFSPSVAKLICYACSLPLQIPVLSKEKYVELPCGHFLHNICRNKEEHKC